MVQRRLLVWQLACGLLAAAWVLFWCARGQTLLAALGALALLLQVWLAQSVNQALALGYDMLVECPPPGQGLLRQRLADWLLESARITWVLGYWQVWRTEAVPDLLQGADPAKVGVLFIHGHWGNRGIWNGWLRRLHAQRRACVAVSLEPLGADLDTCAPAIEAALQTLIAACAGRPPLLICHSMGGLAARAWWRAWRQAHLAVGEVPPALGERVVGLVTLGTPHQGAWLAHLGRARNLQRIRPGQPWLRALNASEPSAELQGLAQSWAGLADVVVFPPRACVWSGAENRELPACGHAGLVFDVRVRAALEARLLQLDAAAFAQRDHSSVVS